MKLDRRKTYYKVIKQNGKHHGMRYQEGLNVNVEPFNDNPEDECCKGRIYITDKENIHHFYDFGNLVWEVKVPQNAKWISEDNKIGVDRLILKNPMLLWKWIIKNSENADLWNLAYHCRKYLKIWWPKVKNRWPNEDLKFLARFCFKNFEIWWPDVKDKWPNYDLWPLAANCLQYPEVQKILKKKGYNNE